MMYAKVMKRRPWMACLSLLVFAGCEGEPSTAPMPEAIDRVDRIAIVSPVSFFTVGVSAQLTAIVYSKTYKIIEGQTVKWSSSDPSIASINDDGVVRGEHGGSAIITASVADKSSSLRLLVQPGDCTQSEGAIEIGETRQGILNSATACALGGEPADSWRLDLTAPTSLLIVLTSSLYFA